MAKSQVTIPIFIPHSGCPHMCIFCNQWSTTGTEKQADADFVHKQVDKYLAGVSASVKHIEIAFFGGSFTAIPNKKQEELLEAANIHLQRKTIQGIRLSTRPDYIDNDILDVLKKYGVTTVELGVQSFDDIVLKASNRGHTAQDSHEAIGLVKKYGFDVIIQLMPGLPGDTKIKSIESASIAASLGPSGARIYPAVVIKNTGLEKLYMEKSYTPLSMEEAVETCKDMHVIFDNKKIPVIRIGLHPFSEDELKNIIAGPYHPSFGFFVKSRIKRDITHNWIKDYIKKNGVPETLDLPLPEKEREEYIGYKKENIEFFKKEFGIKNINY